MQRLIMALGLLCFGYTIEAAKEIEAKLSDNQEIHAFKNWVKDHGTLKKKVSHKETYFNVGTAQEQRENMYLIIANIKDSGFVQLTSAKTTHMSILRTTVDDSKVATEIAQLMGYNKDTQVTDIPDSVKETLPKKASSITVYDCSKVTPQDFLFKSKQGFIDTKHTLRVRHCKNEADNSIVYKVCLKRCHSDATHRDEFETAVGDGNTMERIIESLGYTTRQPLNKNRVCYTVTTTKKDGDKQDPSHIFEVVFDEVHKLGKFVEVELKGDITSVQDGQKKLFSFLRDAGIENCTMYTRNYLHMALNNSSDMFKRSMKISDMNIG